MLGGLLSFLSLSAFSQPISDFTLGAESWGTIGKCPIESSPGANWSATGGNPGGMIYETDEASGTVYWNCSGAEWKADLTEFYGCYLYYEQKTSDVLLGISAYEVLLIRGDDHALCYNSPYNPGNSWSANVIPLDETGWVYEGLFNSDATCPDLSGTAATMADMLSFLADIKRIRIRAEFAGLAYETNYMDNVQIVCDLIGLAVEMSQFNGYDIGNNKCQLDWVTQSETENRYFQIEKSLTGQVFDSLGIVIGNGNSLDQNNYSFTDNQFSQSAFYRLKTVNYDNISQYSDVIFVDKETQSLSSLRVDPNPSSTVSQLIIADPEIVYRWELLDLSGNVLAIQEVVDYNGWYTTPLDVSNLNSGIYIIRVATNHGFMITRFQVIR